MATHLLLGLALAVAAPGLKDPPKKDPAHVGRWVPESIMLGGQAVPSPDVTIRLAADGTFERRGTDGKTVTGTFTTDLRTRPAQLDIAVPEAGPGASTVAIFKVDGDTLTICSGLNGARPTAFESPAGSRTILMVLKRKKD